jgi:hypothetical protein
MGAVLPVITPFIFFSLRSTSMAVRDAVRLCELAAPFMVVLAVCSLMGTMHSDRRGLGYQMGYRNNATRNASAYLETNAPFNAPFNATPHLLTASEYLELPLRAYSTAVQNPDLVRERVLAYAVLLLSPLVGLCSLRCLVWSVLNKRCTEFMVAFLLVIAARFGLTHDHGGLTVASCGLAALAFCLVLLMRR